jgi:hypothetical protein
VIELLKTVPNESAPLTNEHTFHSPGHAETRRTFRVWRDALDGSDFFSSADIFGFVRGRS